MMTTLKTTRKRYIVMSIPGRPAWFVYDRASRRSVEGFTNRQEAAAEARRLNGGR